MTPPPDQPTGLPPEQEAVRRLLADARHDGPTPPEVVARLDATLASLAAEREPAPSAAPTSTSAGTTAPVVDLAARRRRLAGTGLLAAAAVVVAGVALGQGLPSMQGSDESGSSAAGGDTATSQLDSGDDAGAGSDSGSDSGGAAESEEMAPQPKTYLSPGITGYPELSTVDADLDDDLVRLRESSSTPDATSESSRATVCEVPDVGRGQQVVVEIDGSLGLVVFRRPDGAAQQADLYVCDDPTVVRTLTLPAP